MATKANPFDEVTKAIEKVKLPGVDMPAILEARRKDIDALTQANQAVYDMMQELARKQTEMLAQAMQGVQDAAKDAADGVGFGDPVKQAALARKACEKALGDMKELAEIARKSQADAMAALMQRANDNMKGGKLPAQQWPARKK